MKEINKNMTKIIPRLLIVLLAISLAVIPLQAKVSKPKAAIIASISAIALIIILTSSGDDDQPISP